MKSFLLKSGWKAFAVFLLLFMVGTVSGQVSITGLPYTKTDNFNSYQSLATLPSGWTTGGSGSFVGVGTGSGNTGGFYAFGASGDFSLGALRSGSATGSYTVSFTNNSGSTITSLALSWDYRQYRFQNVSGWNLTGTGSLAANATLNAKDFSGVATGTSGATTPVASFTLTGLSIASGQSFGMTWVVTDETGSDNGVAIDNFSMEATGAPALTAQTITFGALSAKTYGDANFALGATASSNLTVSYASSNTAVATVSGNTVIIVGQGTTNITASQAGNSTYSAATNVVQGLTVNKKGLTVTGASANNKVYDRTTTATISGAALNGIVGSDNVTLSGGGTFNTNAVADGKPVTPALTLAGTKAGNYTLAQPTGLTANITAKQLTIASAAAGNKVYDRTTDATLTGSLSGVIAPDAVALTLDGTFDSASVGTAIPVVSASSISGAAAANYSLLQPSGLAAAITAKPLTIANAEAQNKIYDGNTNAIITGTLTGVIAPDAVTLNGTGTFADPAVALNVPVTYQQHFRRYRQLYFGAANRINCEHYCRGFIAAKHHFYCAGK